MNYAYLISCPQAPDAVITFEPLVPGVNVTCWDCLGWWRQERCATCHPFAFPGPLWGGRAKRYKRRR